MAAEAPARRARPREAEEESMSDSRGVYEKFRVERTDGKSEPGQKHAKCRYFVLDIDHDKHAAAALKAYAEDCKDERPELAIDLLHTLVTSVDEFERLMHGGKRHLG